MRTATKIPGVYTITSATRRHKGKADIGYVIDWQVEKKRHRDFVGWASEGMTARRAAHIRQERISAASASQRSPDARPMLTIAQGYEIYRRDWLVPQGKRTAPDDSLMRGALSHIVMLPLDALTPRRIDELMSELRESGRSAQTIRHAVGLLRRVMNRLARWDLYDGPMPWAKLTLPMADNSRQRYLTPDEAQALLRELRQRSPRVWCMSLIALHCGLRFGEIAHLRWADIHWHDATLYIARSKSGRARHAVMTDDVMQALRELPQAAPQIYIFARADGQPPREKSSTFDRAVSALGLNAGVYDRRQKVVFHTLRHTYASWLALSGERELAIADLLGHTSTAMTRRYAHLMDSARRGTADKISAIFHGEPPDSRR